MKRGLVLLLGVLAGACAARSAPPAGAPPGIARRGLAAPQALRVDPVTPTDVVAVAFCSLDPFWTALPPADQWYLITIDGAQQPWAGQLLPDPAAGAACVKTPSAFSFPAGNGGTPAQHFVLVRLVYPGSVVMTLPEGPESPCVVGQDCYGAPSDPLTVVSASTTPTGVLTGAPPQAVNGQIIR